MLINERFGSQILFRFFLQWRNSVPPKWRRSRRLNLKKKRPRNQRKREHFHYWTNFSLAIEIVSCEKLVGGTTISTLPSFLPFLYRNNSHSQVFQESKLDSRIKIGKSTLTIKKVFQRFLLSERWSPLHRNNSHSQEFQNSKLE